MDYQKKYLKYKKKYSFLKQKGGIPPPEQNFDEDQFLELVIEGNKDDIIDYLNSFEYISFTDVYLYHFEIPEEDQQEDYNGFYLHKFKNDPKMINLFIDKYLHINNLEKLEKSEFSPGLFLPNRSPNDIIFIIQYIITNILPLQEFNESRHGIILNMINKLIKIYSDLFNNKTDQRVIGYGNNSTYINDGTYINVLEYILAEILLSIIITNNFTEEYFFSLWEYIHEKNINTSLLIKIFLIAYMELKLQLISNSGFINFDKINENFLVEFFKFGIVNGIKDRENNSIMHMFYNTLGEYIRRFEGDAQQQRPVRRRRIREGIFDENRRVVMEGIEGIFDEDIDQEKLARYHKLLGGLLVSLGQIEFFF